jgi:hypothetical protein
MERRSLLPGRVSTLWLFGLGAAGNKIWQGLRRLDIAQANYQTKALGRWTGPRIIE